MHHDNYDAYEDISRSNVTYCVLLYIFLGFLFVASPYYSFAVLGQMPPIEPSRAVQGCTGVAQLRFADVGHASEKAKADVRRSCAHDAVATSSFSTFNHYAVLTNKACIHMSA